MQCGGQRTDELTNMLTPGTSTRDIKACAIKKNRLLSMDKDAVAEHTWYVPSDMKQSSALLDIRTYTSHWPLVLVQKAFVDKKRS